MSKEEKKSLFDRAIDALTDRDEKAAAAETQAKAEAEAKKAARLRPQKTAAERAVAGRPTRRTVTASQMAPAAPRKGVVTVRSLRVRADHSTASEVVGGLVNGDEVTILTTWSDGKDTWAKLANGWAAMVYDGEDYIKPV
jgi:ATPase subunit of ABC transporter with duplicated ATPase domains